ncbi:MAG: hypothetical protein K6T86_13070 [Pirellulales bacterium]|nr:hypothetical protein [Pirellulales bacterium]
MSHPLQNRLAGLRRGARLLLLIHALSWLIVAGMGAALVLGVLDYWIRYTDPGMRWLSSLCLAAAVVYAGRYLVRAVAARLSDLELALRVERRFPELRDRLSSAVQFLGRPVEDPLAGSAALRARVISQATAELEPLDLRAVLAPRPVYRVAAAALLVLLLALGTLLAWPQTCKLALQRLLLPGSSACWPRKNNLALRKVVRRVALGQAFEVEVYDTQGAALPDEVFIYYRYDDAEVPGSRSASAGEHGKVVKEPMRFVNNTLLARKEPVLRPFSYRIEGGDHRTMPWIRLEVVEPPAVERLRLTLTYPEYPGWPNTQGEGPRLRALVGTRVAVRGWTTKPISKAALCTEDGQRIEGRVLGKGYQFVAPLPGGEGLVVRRSGSWWVELIDRERLSSGNEPRYELQAVPDEPPAAEIHSPEATLYVTPQASVPVRVSARDDLALRQLQLQLARSDRTEAGEAVLPLYAGPQHVPPPPGTGGTASAWLPDDQGDSASAEMQLELAPLELPAGTEVTLVAVAFDYRHQQGTSAPRKLMVVTLTELEDRLAQRQAGILAELARLLRLQRESRAHLTDLSLQWEKVPEVVRQDVDHLQSAELAQQSVERGLISPSEGVAAQVESLLADLKHNQIDSPDAQRHLERLREAIAGLAANELPEISRALTAAFKRAGELAEAASQPDEKPAPPDQRLLAEIESAGRHQQQVVEVLEQLVAELSEWDNYRRFHRDIAQLRRDQQALAQTVAELARATQGRQRGELAPQQLAELEKLAARQLELARELERIQQNMDQAAQDLQESDPLSAANVADALDFARRGDLSGSMRRSGRQVQENQVAQAVKAQAQLDEQLREMQDILANRRDQELQRLVKKLREAEDQLAAMREEQAGLRKKLRQAADESDDQARRRELERLAREERRLQQEAARLARTLRRLAAQRAARRMADAAARLAASGEQGEQGNAEQAGQQAEAAERDLEQAMQELRRERQQAEADLAEEQLARLEDGLRGIRDRQAQLIEETRLYHQAATADGLTPAQQESVRVLGRQQQFLRDETHAWAERLAAARSFELALTSAAGAMERAATLLRNLELGQDTQAAESRALARLDQILQALAPDQPPQPREGEQPEQQGEPGQQGENQPSPQQGDGIRSVAELKLLKLLQDDLNARTRELAEALRDVPHPNPAQQQELAELSAEQGRLADLLLELTQVPDESDAGDVEPPGLDDLELDDVDQTDSDASGDDRPLAEPQGDQPDPAEHLEDLLPFPDQTAIRPHSGRIDPENSP